MKFRQRFDNKTSVRELFRVPFIIIVKFVAAILYIERNRPSSLFETSCAKKPIQFSSSFGLKASSIDFLSCDEFT